MRIEMLRRKIHEMIDTIDDEAALNELMID